MYVMIGKEGLEWKFDRSIGAAKTIALIKGLVRRYNLPFTPTHIPHVLYFTRKSKWEVKLAYRYKDGILFVITKGNYTMIFVVYEVSEKEFGRKVLRMFKLGKRKVDMSPYHSWVYEVICAVFELYLHETLPISYDPHDYLNFKINSLLPDGHIFARVSRFNFTYDIDIVKDGKLVAPQTFHNSLRKLFFDLFWKEI